MTGLNRFGFPIHPTKETSGLPWYGPDAECFAWCLTLWPDVTTDWPGHEDFYRKEYRKHLEYQARQQKIAA